MRLLSELFRGESRHAAASELHQVFSSVSAPTMIGLLSTPESLIKVPNKSINLTLKANFKSFSVFTSPMIFEYQV